ncbi:hypothetical protein ACHAWU_005620 [Discostella pseudostelligera]|uniref:Uncharacterized protein n=1 Tax=Discostella pseudostelligera TaxID=259834 RepID=A0ABD3M045_9STRA
MGQTNALPIYPSIPRGGACSDSTPRLFAKIALGAAVETSLMYALIDLIITLKSNNRHSGNSTAMIAIFQTIVLLSIIFGSSTFGAIVDRGLSAATKQILDPNQIPGDANWYANLKKPRWNPPGWLFPIMWLIISKPTQFMAVTKLLAAASSNTNKKELSIPLLAYCTHLSLGDAWNKVFFGLECTGRGLAVIFTFWSALWLCAYLFGRKDRIAGLLLLPTCLWVTVATILNWSIYRLNRQE